MSRKGKAPKSAGRFAGIPAGLLFFSRFYILKKRLGKRNKI